jgi:hypothetical protein
MRRALAVVLVLAPVLAFAEASITNKDANSYSYKMQCGSNNRDGSVAGGATNKFSIPAGSTECKVTLANGSTCSLKDGGSCTIQSGKF